MLWFSLIFLNCACSVSVYGRSCCFLPKILILVLVYVTKYVFRMVALPIG